MNFIGKPVDGYEAERCLATQQTASALANVQKDLKSYGLGLKVFDAYRPQRAVDHFVRWAKDTGDTSTKARYCSEDHQPAVWYSVAVMPMSHSGWP